MEQMIPVEDAAKKHEIPVDELTYAVCTEALQGPIGGLDDAGIVVFDDDNLRAWVEQRTEPASRSK